jgi:hypothetical protein
VKETSRGLNDFDIYLIGLRKITQNHMQDSQIPRENLN